MFEIDHTSVRASHGQRPSRGALNLNGVVGPATPFVFRGRAPLRLAGLTGAQVRAARAEDLPAVLALWRTAGAVPSVTDDLESLRLLFAADPKALLVIEADGFVAGTLIAAWDGWRGSFYRLAVAPDLRRQGLARSLVSAGEARLRSLGARRLTAFVDTGEEHALAFWTALGYTPQRDRLRFVSDVP